MSGWVCPHCRRQFARSGQGHECAPAMSLDEYFATGPPFERPVFDAVMAHLRTMGEPFLEPVSVGVFVKRDGVSVLQLRPMTKWVAMGMCLPSTVRHPRIARKPVASGRIVYHVVNLRSADDVDEVVQEWITEAWVNAADR
ncbi:MAG: DUF5655 domain-containing protein [Actinomycetota bacterium]|nr:DUF5655 domain-containing protein [Actinomycetota bacterium]